MKNVVIAVIALALIAVAFLLGRRSVKPDIVEIHRTDTVVWGFRQAADWARAAGYTQCVVLTLSGREICPL